MPLSVFWRAPQADESLPLVKDAVIFWLIENAHKNNLKQEKWKFFQDE